MSFITTTTQAIPTETFPRALGIAKRLRAAAVNFRDQAVAGSVNTADLQTGFLSELVNSRIELVVAQTTPGMLAYAKAQFDDPTYDIAAEFTTMMAAMDTIAVWFEANFPTGASGHLESHTFVGDGSGATVSDTITAAGQLTALVAEFNALIATID